MRVSVTVSVRVSESKIDVVDERGIHWNVHLVEGTDGEVQGSGRRVGIAAQGL